MKNNKLILKTDEIIPKKTLSSFKFNIVKEGDILPIEKNKSIIIPKNKIGIWFRSGDGRYHHKILDEELNFDSKIFFRALGLYYAEGLKSIKDNSKYAISFVNANSLAIEIITKFFKVFLNNPFRWRIKYHKGYQKYVSDKYNINLTENQIKNLLKIYWIKECKLKENLFYSCYKCTRSNINYTRVPLFGVCYLETNDIIMRSILDNILLKTRRYLLLNNKEYIYYFLQGLWGGDGSLSIRPKHRSLHFIRITGIANKDKEFIKDLFKRINIHGSFVKDKSVWEFRIYSYLNFIKTARIDLYCLRSGNEYQLGEINFIKSLFNHEKHRIFSLLKFFDRGSKTVNIIKLVDIAYRTIDAHLNNLSKEGYLIKNKIGRDNVYRLSKKGRETIYILNNLKNKIVNLESFIKYRESKFTGVITI